MGRGEGGGEGGGWVTGAKDLSEGGLVSATNYTKLFAMSLEKHLYKSTYVWVSTCAPVIISFLSSPLHSPFC